MGGSAARRRAPLPHFRRRLGADGVLTPPELDVSGYLSCAVLDALASSGRALEINTKVPFAPELVRWWADAGGEAVSFGSDAHLPAAVAHGFAEAAATARAWGFRPTADPVDLWPRTRSAVSVRPSSRS